MIGIDTNVLVRYLTQDDAEQSKVATRFIEQVITPENPGHITAHGSSAITATMAIANICDTAAIRPDHSATATTVSITSVRCAGIPKPASAT